MDEYTAWKASQARAWAEAVRGGRRRYTRDDGFRHNGKRFVSIDMGISFGGIENPQ